MTTPAGYEQRHAGLTPFVLTVALVAPVVFLAALIAGAIAGGVTASIVEPVAGALLVFALLLGGGGLLRMAPLGFRVDAQGVRIGRLGRRARDTVSPAFQARGRFEAPWSAITRAEVVTDRAEVAALRDGVRSVTRNAPRRAVPNPYGRDPGIGVGAGQFVDVWARAYLVVHLDRTRRDEIVQPVFRRGKRGQGHLDVGTWLVPVRHPDRVRDAVRRWSRLGESNPGQPHYERVAQEEPPLLP